jgi:hypothetical protein
MSMACGDDAWVLGRLMFRVVRRLGIEVAKDCGIARDCSVLGGFSVGLEKW